ncbi:RNA polymerase sigma-70 factor, ECF subfamily [Hathewaya proteolytica DSM 3090]|uniref:RNA polymerase sigma-70 factor, ECF subfamily n=1 Tax=Hathewaya proteolytica DSM 3090 TaxID=1121331 RepID=A0A1M6P5V1_9CLOT|nr:RNA polymerase sigma-70 factor, ECF subfamily [Hathewaya proteolytica DSM 3090]
MTKITEEKLIKLVKKNGDKSAASSLIEIYYKDIYIYVYRQTHEEELAKDLTQETFISMLKSMDKFDEKKANFRTWLYKIASNKIIDIYRSTYYRYVIIVEEIERCTNNYNDNFENLFYIKEDTKEILQILSKFNTNIQQIIRLKIFGEMTFAEIANLLELSESTVKSRYYATIKNIKKAMEVKNNGSTER